MQTQQVSSGEPSEESPQEPAQEPLTLPYREAPTGEVVASDAALLALKRTRPWALLLAIGMLVYAGLGLLGGLAWLYVLITKAGQPGYSYGEFIVLSTVNLVLAPIAGVGGVLVMRYRAAAGRAYNGRSSEELERALIRQLHIWRWGFVLLIALVGMPAAILFVAALMNVWP
ncbi:MAG TPA: hypothetical protein VGR35_13400 [Tepidisphaeraceae bacterium]|nr:hypothetical protein [Tepidisphaeraceae bacterium]